MFTVQSKASVIKAAALFFHVQYRISMHWVVVVFCSLWHVLYFSMISDWVGSLLYRQGPRDFHSLFVSIFSVLEHLWPRLTHFVYIWESTLKRALSVIFFWYVFSLFLFSAKITQKPVDTYSNLLNVLKPSTRSPCHFHLDTLFQYVFPMQKVPHGYHSCHIHEIERSLCPSLSLFQSAVV